MADGNAAGRPGIAAVRGAIQVPANRAERIQESTARLLTALMEENALEPSRIVSAIFTATPDLDADFPAHAARRLGWSDVPLLGAVEMAVPGAPPRIVRVLLTVNGVPEGMRLRPVYLDGAAALRPDLAGSPAPAQAAGPPRTLALIGLGQIGGSIGLAMAGRHDWRRVGYDLDPSVIARAKAADAIDEAAESVEAACREAALAVIATPMDAIPSLIREAATALPKGAALLDTGSARAGATAALEAAAAHGVRAVGGHPLAGHEGHGFDSARAWLFEGARFALCPLEGGVPPIVGELVRSLGAEALVVSPAEHDAALGRTSHLPYLIARALERAGGEARARGLSGPAFRDMTRIAASDSRMAEAYCRANLTEVRSAWDAVRAEVEALIRRLGTA